MQGEATRLDPLTVHLARTHLTPWRAMNLTRPDSVADNRRAPRDFANVNNVHYILRRNAFVTPIESVRIATRSVTILSLALKITHMGLHSLVFRTWIWTCRVWARILHLMMTLSATYRAVVMGPLLVQIYRVSRSQQKSRCLLISWTDAGTRVAFRGATQCA